MISLVDIKNAKEYIEKEINGKEFDTPIAYAKAMHKILSDVTIKFSKCDERSAPLSIKRANEIYKLYATIIELSTYMKHTKSIVICSDDLILSLYDNLSYMQIYSQYGDYDRRYRVNINTCTVIDEDDMDATNNLDHIPSNYTFSDYSNICTEIVHIKEHLLKVFERCDYNVCDFADKMGKVFHGAKYVSDDHQKLVAAVLLTSRFYSNGGASWDTYENIYLSYKALKDFYDASGNLTSVSTQFKEEDTGTIYLVDVVYNDDYNIIDITFLENKNKYLNPIKNNFTVLKERV